MIKVFGHKPPDTDSVCSPIVYAWYLTEKKNTQAVAYIAAEVNKEIAFVLKKFGVEKPEMIQKVGNEDQVIILDTNNPEELLEGVNESDIVEIIDHHKLAGGLTTETPIKITIRPVACTATILWNMMKQEENRDIPKEMAGLLLAAILSDTLKFTSPTTTEEDKSAAEELAERANIKIDEFTEEMFEAKSDLSGMSAKDILLSDSKTFNMGGKKVRVSVLETTKAENALSMKDLLVEEMRNLKKEETLDSIFFFIVDILESASDLLVGDDSDQEIAKNAFEKDFQEGKMHLEGVVSRKKQMIPNIEKAIKR
jgi:manganese-dependent inorganic pyrophosphatase